MRTLPVIAHLWSKKDSITDAYAEALSEVIANLKRTLDR